ncbi:MAG TPA: NADP-dependent oxidoreductase [Phenylobacterium sp.]|uniref:NADP-dependent oxidoreductase n=1 Tax=Phenylobacterium sp. TaxID=1871053 RepID=UPI002B470F26|nr:NADP-dependent oxidoreductase [Phenylobacterium sp.]HKR90201.1 NADP-dependent oxidoreductase [Phenylobacterium sp.]
MSPNRLNRRFALVRRPEGMPVAADFQLLEEPLPPLADGQFLLRNHYASLDPAMRGWMDDRPSYVPPIQLGDPVRALTVGMVVESRNPDYPVGQWACGMNAIEDYSLGGPGRFTNCVDPDAVLSVTNYLSAVGTVGFTAYFALLEGGEPKAGETVLVTGAAGAVGSLVGQIAKMKGCRTIGIAGGPAKCDRLLRDYGYDAAIDYRGKSPEELTEAIRAAAPDGVDVHFENVGGEILDAGLLALNQRARVVICGLISQYNSDPYPTRNLWQLIVKGARMQGFILTHYVPRIGEAIPVLADWVKQGKLRVDEHIEEGIENALPAFLRLFDGTNQGKMILKIA